MDGKKHVYYDGVCRVCSGAVDAYAKEGYVKHDVSGHDLPPGVSYETAMQYMHVVDTDGTVYKGADAAMRIMDEHPLWRFVARIGRLPGFHALAVALYRIIATHRYLLGRK